MIAILDKIKNEKRIIEDDEDDNETGSSEATPDEDDSDGDIIYVN